MQLSAKALLRPFTSTAVPDPDADTTNDPPQAETDNMPDHDSDIPDDRDQDEDEGSGNDGGDNEDDEDDEDTFETLTAEEREQLLGDTATVRATLDKVCSTTFSLAHHGLLTTGFKGSKTLLCNYSLHYNHSSRMA